MHTIHPGGLYGACFWLKTIEAFRRGAKRNLSLPVDMFFTQGFEGNVITIIRSRRLIVVRLGFTRDYHCTWD